MSCDQNIKNPKKHQRTLIVRTSQCKILFFRNLRSIKERNSLKIFEAEISKRAKWSFGGFVLSTGLNYDTINPSWGDRGVEQLTRHGQYTYGAATCIRRERRAGDENVRRDSKSRMVHTWMTRMLIFNAFFYNLCSVCFFNVCPLPSQSLSIHSTLYNGAREDAVAETGSERCGGAHDRPRREK